MSLRRYEVHLSPDAVADLGNIYDYIADASGIPEVAWRYISTLKTRCESLQHAPLRGRARDDIRSKLRILSLDGRAIAAFEVDEKEHTELILNIFYGGEDYDTIMRDDEGR